MSKKRHFKSKATYQKWLAYGHIRGIFEKTPGSQDIYIGGKQHKVRHKKVKRKYG